MNYLTKQLKKLNTCYQIGKQVSNKNYSYSNIDQLLSDNNSTPQELLNKMNKLEKDLTNETKKLNIIATSGTLTAKLAAGLGLRYDKNKFQYIDMSKKEFATFKA